MNLTAFRHTLAANPGASIHLMLPDQSFVPAHFHITDIGRVRKDFIDCGGTARSTTTCLLQVWVATDTDHRLDTSKLEQIFQFAEVLLGEEDMPVEVEYEGEYVSQFPVCALEVTPAGLLFHLGGKHTACLAPEKCGLGSSCC